jgi:PAS domain S-box-containing protein
MPNKNMEQRLVELRRRAQRQLGIEASESLESVSEEALHLLEELHIHQIELEIQNEDLRRTQQQLEASHEAYRALYEFAPTGYFTLTEEGLILQANPVAANQLGMTEPALLHQPLAHYVARESQEIFFKHRRWALKSKSRQACELELVRADGTPFYVHMESLPILEETGEYSLRTAIIDITERKHAEQENEQLLEVLQQKNQQVRALSRRLVEVQEVEQQRIAQELHDRVGQGLTAIGFHLEYLKGQVEKLLPEAQALHGHLGTTLELVAETTDRVRNLMTELRPPMLDEYGLLTTFEWYGEEFAKWSGVLVQVYGKEPAPRLPSQVENVLFRILQEVLTNVAKHAKASEVVVLLQPQAEFIRLIITDNGIGLEAARQDRAERQKSWGLQIMSERAEMIGGLCRIESQPGQGTRVTVEVPAGLEGEEREEKRREEKRREEKRRDYTQSNHKVGRSSRKGAKSQRND